MFRGVGLVGIKARILCSKAIWESNLELHVIEFEKYLARLLLLFWGLVYEAKLVHLVDITHLASIVHLMHLGLILDVSHLRG